MRNTTILLFLFFYFNVTGQRGDHFFSPNGDTVLNLRHTNFFDTTYVSLLYYSKAKAKNEMELVRLIKFKYSDSIDNFVFPDSLKRFASQELEYVYNIDKYDTLAKITMHIATCHRTNKQQGGCSKGCSWSSYYKGSISFDLMHHGKSIWYVPFTTMYFVDGDYIAWGAKPKRRGISYFKRNPEIVLYTDFYWSKNFNKLFISMYYFTEPLYRAKNPTHIVKYFLL